MTMNNTTIPEQTGVPPVGSMQLLGCGEWPTMPLMKALGGDVNHQWHVAINRRSEECREAKEEWPKWMYAAKEAAGEVPRLALLFAKERLGQLCKTFRRCSCCSDQKHVVDNHLTCCLGVECRKCPHLAALDKAELPPEQRDWIKAWTCAGHILTGGGDMAGEGFLMTVDDRMYWDSVHESLASSCGSDDDETQQPN
ncbi:MAG: hypothetical protein KGL39_28335, partial [Patescibacteria group bacterium]|nr:hypothetical protein [Patescibacteria group bacterium]